MCYGYAYQDDNGAHPAYDGGYYCKNINNNKSYKITDLFDQKELRKKSLTNKNLNNVQFLITKLNSDATVNITYMTSTTEADADEGSFDTKNLNNLHSKVKITKLLTAESLNTISNKK